MKDLKTRITENGIDYVLVGDYYIPDLKLPEEKRSIGKWGRMHREYLKKQCYGRYSSLLLTGKLWSYLEDLDEQAEERFTCRKMLCFGYNGVIILETEQKKLY